MTEPKKTKAYKAESFGRKSKYSLGLDEMRTKYSRLNPNFEEMIKTHSRLMGKCYTIHKPENSIYCIECQRKYCRNNKPKIHT